MKNKIVEVVTRFNELVLPVETLSMKPFIDYIKKAKENASPHKQKVLSFVLKKCEAYPEVEYPIPLAEIHKYSDLLQLVYATTSPVLEEEQLHFWALSMPVSPVIFYSTDAFFSTIADERTSSLKKNNAPLNNGELNKSQVESCYALLLQRCYNLDTLFLKEIIYPFEEDGSGGITRYFKINFDDRFIKVSANTTLPPLTFDPNNYDKKELLSIVQKELPLDMFCFEGMSILTVSEVTTQYAVENIKKSLTNASIPAQEYYPAIIKSLKTLARSKDIEFGLFPLLKLNNKFIFNKETCVNSLLLRMFEHPGSGKVAYHFFNENYLLHPKLVFFQEIPSADTANFISVNTLKADDIKSYALIPIYFNNALCGVLEMYTWESDLLSEDVLPKVDPALPFIAQIFQKNINDFESEIEGVIKNHFTAMQPSVQWKFNEAAWNYIKESHLQGSHKEIETIAFEQVYPLYGAVDLRNSTVERNEALLKDLQVEFEVLIEVLTELKSNSGFGLMDEKIFLCQKWLEKIRFPEGFNQESRVNEFLENEIVPFLNDFKTGDAAYVTITNRYFNAINERDGIANEHRRQLEHSMKTIISAVNNYMELMKEEMQKAYPCYFEKFRTDGVEYDVYIGQAISPEKPFKEIYLNNLRLMQLTSMAALARYTNTLMQQLVKQIETTQLIFIHSHPIDIRFRKDEKRFDVEGAYNIRYQIVKKRIDKVHIKGSRERLTIPNKIALVYFSQKEADEYAGYIHYLKEKGVLADDLEYLELEQLQGINGLKAMRVGVVLD
jgi:hypothetical protein